MVHDSICRYADMEVLFISMDEAKVYNKVVTLEPERSPCLHTACDVMCSEAKPPYMNFCVILVICWIVNTYVVLTTIFSADLGPVLFKYSPPSATDAVATCSDSDK